MRNKKRKGGSGVPPGSKTVDSAPLESKAQPVGGIGKLDDEKGVCEAYVSITGIEDAVGDVIEPGAYEKTLKTRTPRGVWSHAWSSPVSKTLAIKEIMPGDSSLPETLSNGEPWPADAGALWVKTQFNLNTPAGRDAYENVKFFSDGTGADTAEWSIGYKTIKSTKDKKGVRHIKELDLYEYSPVLHGANRHAKTLSVKSLDEALEALHIGGYDTSELDVKSAEAAEASEGLSMAEVKAIPLAIEVLSAYADEIGLKRSAPVGDPDLEEPDDRWVDSEDADGGQVVLPSLAERLEDVLEAEDFPELLEAADSFDAAVQAGDDGEVASSVQRFLEVFEAEEADDPEDPDTWDGLRDVVADAMDDANMFLYGAVPDEDVDGEVDDEFEDEADEDEAEFENEESGEDVDVEELPETDQVDAGKSAARGEVKGPSQAERDKAAKTGAAMDDGSFPIRNASELRKAWNLRNNGNKPASAVVAHIRKRAKALGLPMPGSDDSDSSGSKKKSEPEPFTLPDLGWASAADDVFKAIDFGDGARV